MQPTHASWYIIKLQHTLLGLARLENKGSSVWFELEFEVSMLCRTVPCEV
jgi:hypothetical protein